MISVINLVKGAESSNFRSLSDFIFHPILGGRHGLDCMVVGFTITCAISAYHH
jgi:hypothetical protein